MGQDGFVLLKPEQNGGEIGSSESSGTDDGSTATGTGGGLFGGGGGGGGGGGLFGTGLFSNRPKPTTQAPVATIASTEAPQIDSDIFDSITEIKLSP